MQWEKPIFHCPREWKTNLVGETNEQGVNYRSWFLWGDYEYTFVEEGKVVTGMFNLAPAQTFINTEL